MISFPPPELRRSGTAANPASPQPPASPLLKLKNYTNGQKTQIDRQTDRHLGIVCSVNLRRLFGSCFHCSGPRDRNLVNINRAAQQALKNECDVTRNMAPSRAISSLHAKRPTRSVLTATLPALLPATLPALLPATPPALLLLLLLPLPRSKEHYSI
jgi:hypothetical protein